MFQTFVLKLIVSNYLSKHKNVINTLTFAVFIPVNYIKTEFDCLYYLKKIS
jgi:hypothetical protein